jgi:hypothetical protein
MLTSRPCLLAVCCVALCMAACGRHGRQANTQGNRNGLSPQADTKSEDECYNPYYPVLPGESLEYETKYEGDAQAPYTFTVTFPDIGDDSFVRRQESSSGLSVDTTWKCNSEGLASTQFGDLALLQTRLQLEARSASGVVIPAADRWRKGAKWEYSYTVGGKMVLGGGAPQSVSVNGSVSVENTIGKEELITVAAGTFDAFKVTSVFTEKLAIKGTSDMPFDISFTAESWYAKDVGLVKATSEDLRMSTELVTFTKQTGG